METQIASWREQYPSIEYVAPFALFLVLLAANSRFSLDSHWGVLAKVIALGVVCVAAWPREISLRPTQPLASAAVGAIVFVLWIAPDLLVPGYRHSILFSNSVLGQVHSSLPPGAINDPWIVFWRAVRAVVVVPVVEELFWRGWLMRWMVNPDFRRVPLGAYVPTAFWITALLFASEHGPYWDVGLVTGIIYNLWMVRTRSVASCIVMHAVTNGLLSAYVIGAGQWQYWQ